MSLPIVESLSGLQESIFNLSRGLQLNSREKSKNWSNFIKLPQLPLLAHVGPMAVWGPLGCCYSDVLYFPIHGLSNILDSSRQKLDNPP